MKLDTAQVGLTEGDIAVIEEALKYARLAIEKQPIARGDHSIGGYPSYEFKQERLQEVEHAASGIKRLRDLLRREQ